MEWTLARSARVLRLLASLCCSTSALAQTPPLVGTNTSSQLFDSPQAICNSIASYWATRSDSCGYATWADGCPSASQLPASRTIQAWFPKNGRCPGASFDYVQTWFWACPAPLVYNGAGACVAAGSPAPAPAPAPAPPPAPAPHTIALVGPSHTFTLPAGPQLNLRAQVSGSSAPGRSVSVTVDGQPAASGVTDFQGIFTFTLAPPRNPATLHVNASCDACSNTAFMNVVAQAPQTCDTRGNPIALATGEKVEFESDWDDAAPHPLPLARYYGSSRGWSFAHEAYVTAPQPDERVVEMPNGRAIVFWRGGADQPWQALSGIDALYASGDSLVMLDASDDSQWIFDPQGRLAAIVQRNGWRMQVQRDSDTVTLVNAFGRTLQLQYVGTRLTQALLPGGGAVRYGWDAASRLSTYPDGSSRTYLYEDGRWPLALTGVIDESGTRLGTYAYDAFGRAVSTTRAGAQTYTFGLPTGANLAVVAPGIASDPAWFQQVTTAQDPLGTTRTYRWQGGTQGRLRLVGVDPPEDGELAATGLASGSDLPAWQTDFLGVSTLYTWDAARRLPVTRTEAAGRPEERTTSTTWHARWRLPVQVDETQRKTQYTYDDFGNLLALGIADTASGASRWWHWSYDARGLMVSRQDPDAALWRFSYDGAGLRTEVHDPAGGVTLEQRDAAGRLLASTSPAGRLTRYAYDARGRLTSLVQGSEATVLEYTPAGQLRAVSAPDGLRIEYTYDAAQRLIAASDNRGSIVRYTLDAMGNPVVESVQDALGNLAAQTRRSIDAYNRLAGETRSFSATQFTHDANGELVAVTDALQRVSGTTLDALRRPIEAVLPDGARVRTRLDAADNLTALTDPKGVTTQYEVNALGDVLAESSPDIGTVRHRRDAMGRAWNTVDAVGNSTLFIHDALGRLVQAHRNGTEVQAFTWDADSQLVALTDASGSTRYERDALGRVVSKVQAVQASTSAPRSFNVAYTRGPGGAVTSITYPDGFKVLYERQLGRVISISTQEPGLRKPVKPFVTGITYNALGQPTGWGWNSGDSASRSYDADGRMTATEFSRYTWDAADRITAITQDLWAQRTTATDTPLYIHPVTWSVGYDARDRITSFARTGAESRFTYDANTNRLSSVETIGGELDLDMAYSNASFTRTTSQQSTMDAASNRLLGFAQTVTSRSASGQTNTAGTQVNYTLDANGNMISDGLRRFEYDPAQRLSSVRVLKEGTPATVRMLTNALGLRVFKTEAMGDPLPPPEEVYDEAFTAWLKRNFSWLFNPTETPGAMVGSAYVYDEEGNLLAIDDNGQVGMSDSRQVIWLPLPDGRSIPVGQRKDRVIYAVHTDHLGTPRLMTNQGRKPVWQWPYSAFGNNEPTGLLDTKLDAAGHVTLLRATPVDVGLPLRHAGQVADAETGWFYNWWRDYMAAQGRYAQADLIGLGGGWNRFAYVGGNPMSGIDPTRLIEYNKPAPMTVPPDGETFAALVCLETCLKGTTGNLGFNLLVTGGAEKGGHSSRSHHYKGEACDIAGPASNKGVNDADAKSCAKACGFAAGQFEIFPNNPNRNHWHFQLWPGNGVPALQ